MAMVPERLRHRAEPTPGGRSLATATQLRLPPQRRAIFRLSLQQSGRSRPTARRERLLHRHPQQQAAADGRRVLHPRRLLQPQGPDAADPERELSGHDRPDRRRDGGHQLVEVRRRRPSELQRQPAHGGDGCARHQRDRQQTRTCGTRARSSSPTTNPTASTTTSPPQILSYGPDGLPLARGVRIPLLLISPLCPRRRRLARRRRPQRGDRDDQRDLRPAGALQPSRREGGACGRQFADLQAFGPGGLRAEVPRPARHELVDHRQPAVGLRQGRGSAGRRAAAGVLRDDPGRRSSTFRTTAATAARDRRDAGGRAPASRT